MGDMKFNLPNDYGIYLHDTPDKAKLKPEYRQISNGCVRLEDARRFARWLMDGPIDTAGTRPEQRVDLPRGVPIYMTYLTASAGSSGVQFRGDPYHRDRGVIYTYTRQRVPIGAW
jgi:murein L,D-transpeptidase YcbB/YkuD